MSERRKRLRLVGRIALTLRLEPETYQKLCQLSSRTYPRRSHQAILETALHRYLRECDGERHV